MEKADNPNNILFSAKGIKKIFSGPYSGAPVFAALSGIDLDIYEGECLLIAGANGSGKTLLMQILAGLTEPTEGEILYRAKPIGSLKNSLRRSVGLVFQDPDSQILGETVEEDIRFGPENLKLGEDEIKKRTEESMAKLDLTEKRDFPARHLSGGEKRRLAVAGILAMGCETIIMDEPFANLDWPGVIQVLKIINTLKQENKTVIILTHELEKVLAHTDRLVILAYGKVKDSGETEAVLNRLDPCWGVRDPRMNYNSPRDCTWL